ncbi:EamA family transporter [Microcella sp.]|uniref:EamA family transporter n=1 Tax=Microcella sp. TaxID=1913979 RepID=UPI003F6F2770
MAVVYTLINALFISVSNVMGGVAARRLPIAIVVAIAGPTTIVIALLLALVLPGTPSWPGFWLGFLAGLFGGSGLPVAYRAFAIGPVGIAGAVLAVVGTALLVLVGVITGDAITPLRGAGLALGLIAILLVTYRPPVDGVRPSLRGPLLAAVAATLFTGFIVTINAAPQADGLWPIVGARFGITTVAMVLLGWMLWREGARTVGSHFRTRYVLFPMITGAADILGNLFLVLALQTGDLVLLAILAPAAPVFTAIIGRVFLRELMTRWQVLGLVVASAALVLASL